MRPDHVPLSLHWWLLVGMGFVALVVTGKLARRRGLMRNARTPPGLRVRKVVIDTGCLRWFAVNGSTIDFSDSGPIDAEFNSNNLALALLKVEPKVIASGYDQVKSIDLRGRRTPRPWAESGSGASGGRESRTYFLPSDEVQDDEIMWQPVRAVVKDRSSPPAAYLN